MSRIRLAHVRATGALMAPLLLLLTSCGSDGGTGPVPEPASPPTIDGVRSPGEWDGATVIPITGGLITGGGPSTVFVTTDGTNIYLALEITDEAEAGDVFSVRFDNDNDDVLTHGDDIVGLIAPGTISDGYYHLESGGYTSDEGSMDGEGAVGQDGETAFYELSHPLNTGDPDDLAADVGDTVGLCFRYSNAGSTNSGQPDACALLINTQANYVDVTLELP